MTRRRSIVALVIAGLLLAGGVTVAAVRLHALLTVRGPTPVYVPARWKQVKDGIGHKQHLAAGDVKCRDCHLFDANGFVAPGVTPCATCHADHDSAVHTSVLAQAATDCFSCHDFGNDPGIKPWACARCHTSQEGPGVAHFDQDCANCHRPHQAPSLAPRDCQDCHEDVPDIKHGRRAVAGASTCLDCHESHDQSIAASRRCQNCHTDRPPIVPVSAIGGGHDRCVQCHSSHDFSKAGARACTTCHQNRRVLGAPEVRAHADCKSCHPQHDVKGAAARCVNCHARQKSMHPSGAKGADCISCHPPHPAAGVQLSARGAVACTSCHTKASKDTAWHAGDKPCTACHAPHGGKPLVARGTQSCVSCHPSQVNLTGMTANRGHVDCLKCHTTANHNPTTTPPGCIQCHGDEARSAPAGHAAACATCHDKHSGKRGGAAACTTCHADRVVGPHTGLKGGCQTCHRAHGPGGVPEPPACSKCHDKAALPNMHKLAGHQKCADCHGAHLAQPRSDRKSCLRCHQDQQQHEPQAATCNGCHPFSSQQGSTR